MHDTCRQQASERGYKQKFEHKGHALLHKYYIELPLGKKQHESVTTTNTCMKNAEIDTKALAKSLPRKRGHGETTAVETTAWGDAQALKKSVVGFQQRLQKGREKLIATEIELETRHRYAGPDSPYGEWVQKVKDMLVKMDASLTECQTFVSGFPKNAKAITVPMEDFVQAAQVAEQSAHAMVDEMEDMFMDTKTVLKAKKAKK